MSNIVTAIVPAYNEEKTIKHVLTTIKKNKNISEIICVDDGSADKTSQIAKKIPGITVHTLKLNKGKGNAMVEGVKKAKGEIIIFLDADLTKLSTQHIDKILLPVLSGEYDAAMGFPLEYITDTLFINVTGQRCYRKKHLLPFLDEMRDSRYGVEILLNHKLKHLKTKNLPLTNLGHIMKHQKRKGKELINELRDWTKEVSMEFPKQRGLDKDKDLLTNVKKIVDLQQAIDFTNKLKEIDVFQTLNEYIIKAQNIIKNRKADELAKVLWKYHHMNHKLSRADYIVVLGCHDLRLPEHAAFLYKNGFAKKILLVGGKGRLTPKNWQKTEAEVFKKIITGLDVPSKDIEMIKNSTNLGENILFSKAKLEEKRPKPKKVIVVYLPYVERRTFASFKKQWPEIDLILSSPKGKFEQYYNTDEERDEIINIMVGDILRIKTYPKLGFHIPQKVPTKVWDAYGNLIDLGFTKYI